MTSHTTGLDERRGGVYRVLNPADETVAELHRAGWRVGRLHAVDDDRRALLAGIGQALGFPGWYGHNLDALWDCLTDLGEPTALVWSGWAEIAARRPDDWAAVLGVFRERTREQPAFALVLL